MTSIKLQITNKNQYANIQIKFGILKLNNWNLPARPAGGFDFCYLFFEA